MFKLVVFFAAIIIGICTVLITSLWLLGTRQPSSAIMKHDSVILLTLKTPDAATISDSTSLKASAIWRATSLLPLVGAEDEYWTEFIVLKDDESHVREIVSQSELLDVSAIRISVTKIPALALGYLRASHKLGFSRRPSGPLMTSMEGFEGRIDVLPSDDAIAALKAVPETQPVTMINFLEYYSGDAADQTSHRDRYNKYGLEAMKAVHMVGGQFLFAGRVKEVIIAPSAGPTVGPWDDFAAMIYPDPVAILHMEQYGFYQKALGDRDASLARTVVIATSEE